MENNNKYITGRLGYNSENGRYGLLVSDLWEHEGFHCGEMKKIMWHIIEMNMSRKMRFVTI